MRTKIIKSLVLCSIILICNNSFGQGPGVFNFNNNLSCTVYVTIFAYDGECESVTCDDDVGSIGTSVAGHSVVNVASGYSGNGDVWGKVEVQYNTPITSVGAGDCSSTGPIYCSSGSQYVQWDSCNGASIP